MPDPKILERLVQQVMREVRLRRAEFWALRGLFAGAVAAAIPLVFREPLGTLAFILAGALLLAGLLSGWLWGFFRRVTPARGRPARRSRLRLPGSGRHRDRVGGAPGSHPAG